MTGTRRLEIARHSNKVCMGYGTNFMHPTIAIAKMLEAEREGFKALTPVLVKGKEEQLAKLTHLTVGCPDCAMIENDHKEEVEVTFRVSRPIPEMLRRTDHRYWAILGRSEG